MKKIVTLCLSVMMFMSLAACNTPEAEGTEKGETITIQHELGETKVKKNPEVVAAFDLGAIDTLDALGVEVDGVPTDSIPTYLEKFKGDQFTNIGGLKEPNFEALSELNPDVIIISGRQAELYDELSEIAPTIYVGVDTNRYLASFEENVQTLAVLFNKEKEAEKAVQDIVKAAKQLNQVNAQSTEKGLVILANDGKVSAYGPKSRFGIIHDELGVKPVDESIEVSTHGQSISFEYIVEKNPDYIFVVDRGAVVGGESSAKQVVENALVKGTKAYKENHIIYLNPEYWYSASGGLRSVQGMIEEISQAL